MNREKKQMLVVGVLVALILGVGAFQFMRSSEAPAPVAKKPEADKAKKADNPELTPPKNPQFHNLPPKDPFVPAAFIYEGAKPDPNSSTEPPKKAVQASGGIKNLGFGGDPNNVAFEGPLVPAGKAPKEKGGSVPPLEPTKPVFGYTLVGIVQGAHPAAVFDDGSGNQQLVEVGQSIGPNATLKDVSNGVVHVKFNAETLVLNVGGNPNAK